MVGLYNTYKKLIDSNELFEISPINVELTGQEASDLIENRINVSKPLMITRFGSNELNCILNYYFINKSLFGNVLNLIKGVPYFLKFKKGIKFNLNIGAGFFPATIQNLERFAEMSLQDLKEINILGSWLSHERYLYPYFNANHTRVNLEDLTPFNHVNPWSFALAGKKVLVIHPFEESIKNQYIKREFLFKDKRVLPLFELKTIKSVVSLGHEITKYKDWFDALDAMTDKITATEFDIALIGCGAYGMPLAARIKRMGKISIHMGGSVQSLFGIKGKRWEGPTYNYQHKFYNDYWIRPLESETPINAKMIESSTYW